MTAATRHRRLFDDLEDYIAAVARELGAMLEDGRWVPCGHTEAGSPIYRLPWDVSPLCDLALAAGSRKYLVQYYWPFFADMLQENIRGEMNSRCDGEEFSVYHAPEHH